MRAAQLDRFGPPDVLRLVELPDPEPGPGQVLIDVEFASITFVETQLRAGRPPYEPMRPELPVVLGNGVSGRVAAVGPDVDPALVGTRVASMLSGRGGYAERAVAEADRFVTVPDGLGSDVAAALLADGRTALAIVSALGGLDDRTALVTAAGGGVGGLLVQLVTGAGGRVVAAAGSAAKRAAAVSLGAVRAVDYTQPSWVDEVGAVDLVLDGVGGATTAAALGALRPGGTLCAFGAAGGDGFLASAADAGRPDVTTASIGPMDDERQKALTSEAFRRAVAGELHATIGQVVDLADAAAAHDAMERRAVVGKTLLRISA